jgi:hypothetical protein
MQLRSTSAIISFAFLAGACASAPEKKAPPPQAAPRPVVTKAVLPVETPPSPAPQAETKPKLEAGQCVEGFDCVDTVGFPPAGQRWACREGKCSQVNLPDLNPPDPATAPPQATASEDKVEAKSKKSKRHHP